MNQTKQVPMMISLPQEARDKLRIFVAESNMRNPNRVATAAGIARELVLEGIAEIERMETMFMASNAEEDKQKQSQAQRFGPETTI